MTRPRLLAVGVVVLAIVGVWLWRPATPPAAPGSSASPEAPAPPAAAAPPLAIAIDVLAAGPTDDLAVTVRAFDKRARQAEAIAQATGGRWRGRGAAGPSPAVTPPADWHTRLQVRDGSGQVVPVAARRSRPDGSVVLAVAAADAPAAGGAVQAVLPQPAGDVVSNAVVREPPPTGIDLDAARARIAQALGRWDEVASIGTALRQSAPTSPWGHYLEGLVLESRGDQVAARAAFDRALSRVTAGQEPPIGLVIR